MLEKNFKQTKYSLNNSITGRPLTNSFILLAVLISFTTTIQSLGIENSNVWSAIQAIFFLCIVLYDLIKYDLVIRYDYIFCVVTLLLIAAINRAPYMISLTMMLTLILMVELYGDNIDYRKVLKTYAVSSIFLFVLVIMAYFFFDFNIAKDVTMWRINKIIDRSSLGFNQPNVANMKWFAIMVSLMGIYNRRILHFLFLFLTLLVYHFTLSRTSTIIIVFALIGVLLLGKKQNNIVPKFAKYIISIIPIILSLISLSFILSSKYSVELNALLSGRLTLYSDFYNMYGIHFLSTPQLEDAMFDNGYLQALLSKGILFCVALLLIYVKLGIFPKKMTYKMEMLYLTILFLGITETALQHFDLFFPLVMLFGKYNYNDC